MAVILPYKGVLPTIHPDAFVAATAVVTGDVEIGPDSSVWYGCTIRGDVNAVRIGAGVNIQDGTVVHVARPFAAIIEDRVSIGHQALIHACTLEEGSFVGMQACVMDGVVVEKGALVAAGSLVTPGKRVGAGEVWAGRPAKFMRMLNDGDRAMLDYTQPRYVDLAREYKIIEAENES
ncbi:MAG: gamma carbonic anhydrase family protein [Alphaproteobacteria bacterium]|nr:gamma carbonic anhydrase family protein [Alphaproteobacteria bacterium]MBF0251129.1 gamma carbonic anhydrase family protein [Alphaproteobacteria bacterium]